MNKPYQIHVANNLDVLPTLPDNSVDAIVCDPPYCISFMQLDFDKENDHYFIETWRECIRVLKPGGHLLAFGATRTYHRLACAIEDAGFEIRTQLVWLFSSGMPKGKNIGLEIKEYDGWNSQLAPAHEPIILVRKPFDYCIDFRIFEDIFTQIELLLWSMLNAEYAEPILLSPLQEGKEAPLYFALWNALENGTLCCEGQSINKAIFKSREAELTLRNIVTLWRNILDGLCEKTSKFTIKMESKLITELKILKLSIQAHIFQGIIRANDNPNDGQNALAKNAAVYFSDVLSRSNDIQKLIAVENAMINEAQDCLCELANFAKQNLGILTQTDYIAAENATGEHNQNETLKDARPKIEPICMARKPISEKTIVANVLRWGVGGLNINATRIPIIHENEPRKQWLEPAILNGTIYTNKHENHITPLVSGTKEREAGLGWAERLENGRYPKTVLLENSDEVREMFPETHSTARPNCTGKVYPKNYENQNCYGKYNSKPLPPHTDEGGSAARYFASFEFDDDDKPLPVGFYCGKVKPSERNAGLEGFELKAAGAMKGNQIDGERLGRNGEPIKKVFAQNNHPTVKPIKLMQYLCRLITPPNGTVLDPFMGSGSTGMAAMREGFQFIGIEMDAEYAAIAAARIEYALQNSTDKISDKISDKIADKTPFVFPEDLDKINPQPPKPFQQKLF